MRSILTSFVWLALVAPGPAWAQDVHFAQITDVHLFDKKGDSDNRAENERGLWWAIDEINRRNQVGPPFEFIAFTGDFGLEEVVDADIPRVAAELRPFLDRSIVRRWLLVPGNNDLREEQPSDIARFHKFVATLAMIVEGSKEVLDFAPAPTQGNSAVLVLGRCVFVGFDNASFKSNDKLEDAEAFEFEQLERVRALKARITAAEKQAKTPGEPPFVYVFQHVPDMYDPYLASFLDGTLPIEKLKESKRWKISASAYPAGAWTVEQAVRDQWKSVVENPHVKRIFAGHFHSGERSRYEGWGWTANLRGVGDYGRAWFDKQVVCPPIAAKNQRDKTPQARGFLDVTVDADTGETKPKELIVWLEPNSGGAFMNLPPPPAAKPPCPAAPRWEARASYLLLFSSVLLTVAVAGIGIAQNSDSRRWRAWLGLLCLASSFAGTLAALMLWAS